MIKVTLTLQKEVWAVLNKPITPFMNHLSIKSSLGIHA